MSLLCTCSVQQVECLIAVSSAGDCCVTQAPYVCVQLPHKAAEVVVLEKSGQQISGELSGLPHYKAADHGG